MTIGVDRLIADLRGLGHAAEGPFESNKWQWLVIQGYTIAAGRFAGEVVRLAVPVPSEFPAVPPGGLYISPKLVPDAEMGGLNIHDRSGETKELGGEWQYWSRPIAEGTWRPGLGAKRLVAHWNTVMSNVKNK